MLTRSQSFPARMPHTFSKNKLSPQLTKKVLFRPAEICEEYSIILNDEFPVTKRIDKRMCFLVKTLEGTEWWSISEFVEYELFTDVRVCEWVNNKNDKAKKFPNTKRRCFMCNRFAIKGKTLCGVCVYPTNGYNYIYD